MQELSARRDLEDARGELHDVLEDYGPSLPARLRAKVRRALALLDSATAKLDGAEARRDLVQRPPPRGR